MEVTLLHKDKNNFLAKKNEEYKYRFHTNKDISTRTTFPSISFEFGSFEV